MPFKVTDVQKCLKGFDYPGDGRQLAEHASGQGASEDLVQRLRAIDRQVDGPSGVMEELKGDLSGN